jgi:hypothetical protein
MSDDLHLARLQPEFARLCGVIGYRIKDTIGWAPWSRLVSLYSWKKVLRAVEQCAPGQRWPADAERYCIQYAKDDADAQSLALKPDPRPRPKDPHEASALFSSIRTKYGV